MRVELRYTIGDVVYKYESKRIRRHEIAQITRNKHGAIIYYAEQFEQPFSIGTDAELYPTFDECFEANLPKFIADVVRPLNHKRERRKEARRKRSRKSPQTSTKKKALKSALVRPIIKSSLTSDDLCCKYK